MSGTSSRISELIWRTDNRSAIRGLKEIADQGNSTAKSLKTDADEESASFDRVRESSSRLRDSLGGLAGMIGIGGVAFGLKDLIEGGMALQQQQVELQQALRATGQEGQNAFARLSSAADALSTHGGFATTQNLAALSGFVRETHSASEAQRMLALATNIARGRNIDLATAQQAVARAYTGSVGRLQQLLGPMVASRAATIGLTTAHQEQIAALQNEAMMMGKMGSVWLRQQEINDHLTNQQIMLAQLTDKHATAQQALALATREFGGATEAFSNTAAGRLQNFQHGLQNLEEELGTALLPAFDKLIAVGTDVANWMEHNKTVVLALVGAFGALGAALGIKEVVKSVHGLYQDMGKLIERLPMFGAASEEAGAASAAGAETATIGWDTFFKGTLIGIGLLALMELITHWQTVERVTVGVWNTITGAVSGAWTDIKRFVEQGAEWVWNKIKWLGDEVGKVFADTPLGGLIGFGENLFSGHVGNAFGSLAQGFTDGVYQARTGSVGLPYRNVFESGGVTHHPAAAVASALSIHPSSVALNLEGRQIANGVIRYALNRAARGPSNMVGGSLVTGAPGIP